jgi:hypothetical protein
VHPLITCHELNVAIVRQRCNMSNVLSKNDVYEQIVSNLAVSPRTPQSMSAMGAMAGNSLRASNFAVRRGRLSLRVEGM